MAHGVKYRTSWQRLSGGTTTVDILEKDYSSSITTLVADNNPLIITIEGEVENIYESTVGSGAQLKLLVTPLTLHTLFTTDPQKYIVKVYNGSSGGTLIWQGFINSKIYQEDYSIGGTMLVPITLNCNDGMALLEEIWYKDNGTSYSGTSTIGEVINTITDKLSIDFTDVYTSNDITVDDAGDVTNIFTNIKVNNFNFIDESDVSMSCREVLDSIFGGLGLVMFFRADKIYVIDPINLIDLSKGKIYELPDYTESTTTTIGGGVDLSGNTFTWFETSQMLDIIPNVNEVQVLYDPYNVTSITYDFNESTNWSNEGSFSDLTDYFLNDTVIYDNWAEGSNGQFIAVKETILDSPIYALYLNNTDTSITWNTNKSLYPDDRLNLKISLESYFNTKVNTQNIYSDLTGNEAYSYYVQFSIKIGDRYFKDDHWEAGLTGNYKQLISIRDWSVSDSQFVADNSVSQVGDVWGSGKKIIPLYNSLSGGTVELTIYDYWTASMYNTHHDVAPFNILIKNIKIDVIEASSGNQIDNSGKMFRGNLSTDVIYKTNPTKIETTNGIGTYGVSRGAFLSTDNFYLDGLYRSGDETTRNTADLILQSFISQYKQPRYKLSGKLNVKNYLLDFNLKLFQDNQYLSGKSFYIYKTTYDDYNNNMDVEMIEITSTRETL